jgi:pyruvate dehydrogenase E1 component alpha subunit
MSDPAKYRSKDEVTTMRSERDPIEQVRKRILEKNYASEDELKDIEKDIRAIVTEAADFATNDPEPEAAELYADILID